MSDCIFCKIIEGKVPAQKVAESANFLAMLDIAPATPGHTLIIPKKHATNFLDLPEYSGSEFIEFTQRVANAVLSGTKSDGFNLVLNNGPAANQIVFHTHFHIVPRKKNDGLYIGLNKWKEPVDLNAIQREIIKHMK